MRRLLPVLLITCAATFVAASPILAEDTIKVGGTGSGTGTLRILADAFHKTPVRGRVVIVPRTDHPALAREFRAFVTSRSGRQPLTRLGYRLT